MPYDVAKAYGIKEKLVQAEDETNPLKVARSSMVQQERLEEVQKPGN
jgi:hypothetical protein